MNEQIFISNSAEETQRIAFNFAQKLQEERIVALYGELGSGKTTFVQGLAKGLGIEKRITSPTFTIIHSYKLKSTSQNLKPNKFFHIDLYRTENISELRELGINELIDGKNIIVIEWAEKMKELLPEKRIDIFFEYLDENKRKITIINF